jgi:hypothetical protein
MKEQKNNLINGLNRLFKNKIFVFVICNILISRSLDFFTTLLYTPDLKKESNVVVKSLELNVLEVSIFQILLIFFVIYCRYLFDFKKPSYSFLIDKNDISIKSFPGYFYFNRKTNFIEIIYKRKPTDKLLYLSGYVVSNTLIVIGYMVGFSTIFLILSENYKAFYSEFGYYFIYSIMIITPFIFTILFFKKEFNRYCIQKKRELI